jgi:type I restriction enzyme S subunit
MNKQMLLSKAAAYSDERIKSANIERKDFVTTDSMLQNKGGINHSVTLPKGNLISFRKGDILVGNIRPYLKKIWYANRNGGCSPDVLVIRAKLGIDTRFLYYTLIRDDFFNHMMKGAKGTKMPRGDKSQIMRFEIPELDINNQNQIASFLSLLDAKVEINNRINEELQSMARCIYDYWFVQFDFPDKNGKPYKSSGGTMVWNEELKREIPEGWEVKELQLIAECIMGQSPKGESYNQNGIGTPLLNGPADYENGALKGRTYTTEPTRLCQKNDLVLCIRATIGNLVYSEKVFCLGRGVAAVRAYDKRLSELIFYLLIQEIERFKVQATGSIIIGITKDDLIESKCLLPNDELINSFHNLIKPKFDKIRINIQENQKLTELRDWLLPMLMNGQVKVN